MTMMDDGSTPQVSVTTIQYNSKQNNNTVKFYRKGTHFKK